MTVLYICTPLARLNKGANAVVLEVNCFKVCLSAMMMKLFVARVKCDRPASSSLVSFFLPRDCFFGPLAREHVARSLAFDLFFFWDFFTKKKIMRVVRVSGPPLPPFPLHLSLSFSLSVSFATFERTKKSTTLKSFLTLFIEYISSSVKHTHNASRVFVAIYCFYYIQRSKRINRYY